VGSGRQTLFYYARAELSGVTGTPADKPLYKSLELARSNSRKKLHRVAYLSACCCIAMPSSVTALDSFRRLYKRP
jgi:hypothetical protein